MCNRSSLELTYRNCWWTELGVLFLYSLKSVSSVVCFIRICALQRIYSIILYCALGLSSVNQAVAHRLGCKACEPHMCMRKAGRRTRTAWTVLSQECSQTTASQPYEWHHPGEPSSERAQVPAVKEPVSLTLKDNKRPDGTTLLPWAKGKPLAWDLMNVEQRQAAVDPQTKPPDLGCESVCTL